MKEGERWEGSWRRREGGNYEVRKRKKEKPEICKDMQQKREKEREGERGRERRDEAQVKFSAPCIS